jgi:hypothetical protein
MLEKLQEYYRQSGISGEHFDCRHQIKWLSVCTDFVSAREAFVGSGYEKNGDLPRLLLVSLDAGGTGRAGSHRNERYSTPDTARRAAIPIVATRNNSPRGVTGTGRTSLHISF